MTRAAILLFRTLAVVVLTLSVGTATFATVLQVPQQYTTITAAVNAAVSGDTVALQAGHYIERVIITLPRLTLTSADYLSGDTTSYQRTIIQFPDSLAQSQDTCKSVIWAHRNQYFALSGVTIRGGFGTLLFNGVRWDRYGGGLVVDTSKVDISHCRFTNGTAQYGGGIGMRLGNLTMFQTQIDSCIGHTANRYGGGISVYADSIIVTNCTFFRNSHEYMYGGLGLFARMYGTMTGCLVQENAAYAVGAGAVGRFTLVDRNRFLTNSANMMAGISLLSPTGDATISVFSNNLVSENFFRLPAPAGDTPGAFFQSVASKTWIIRGNTFSRHSTSPSNPNECGALTLQSGRYYLSQNDFIDNTSINGAAITTRGDFQGTYIDSCRFQQNNCQSLIKMILPCTLQITRSDFISNGGTIVRFDDTTAVVSARECYFGDPSGPRCGTNPGGTGDSLPPRVPFEPFLYEPVFPPTGVPESKPRGELLPIKTKLLDHFPNPFNASTTIKYTIAHTAKIELAVFDITGREVGKLVDFYQNPGEYSVKFDGTSLSTGSYFVRLKADNFVQTRKMVLLK